MPRYTVRCPDGHESDVVCRWDARHLPCPSCDRPTERVWTASAAVIGDECDFYDPNLERRFTSKAEHLKEITARGWVHKVKHMPMPGTDKSTFTKRWDTCPATLLQSEEDRIARWHQWDREQGLTTTPTDVAIIAPEPASVFSPQEQRELSDLAARVGL